MTTETTTVNQPGSSQDTTYPNGRTQEGITEQKDDTHCGELS